jgi:hypothetical protein
MKKIIIYFSYIFLFPFISCSQEPKTFTEQRNNTYKKYRKNFNEDFINQFPNEIAYPINSIISYRDVDHNNVGFFLFEYEINKDEIIKIKLEIGSKYQASYNPKDSCLLIVNRFNYIDSTNFIKTKKIDNALLNRACYKGKYPIPNFLEYKGSEGQTMKLSENYIIYVLEAKPEEYDDRYKMKINKQMPKEWEHGYSKGIALNEKDKEVIYWSIMW